MPDQRSSLRGLEAWFERLTTEPFKVAWLLLTIVTATLTVAAGLLIRITDPKDIHSLGEGLWWAVQTVTTVGYGDVVPTSPLGRIVGVAVMITGIAFLTVTTAAITNLFIEQARRRRNVTGEAGEEIAVLSERIDALVAEVRALRESHEDHGR
jgi:voltage-gated potassium channel